MRGIGARRQRALGRKGVPGEVNRGWTAGGARLRLVRGPAAVHGLAALWLAWVATATAYAGGDPVPWLWGLYIVTAYVLVEAVSPRWRWPLLAFTTAVVWWLGSWAAQVPGPSGIGFGASGPEADGLGGSAMVGVNPEVGEPGVPTSIRPGMTADQAIRVAADLLRGDWAQALAEAGGPLGRGAALVLCGLTTWVFARSVERGLLWTWLLAGETVLALTDSFFVNQAPSLVGTVILGILVAAAGRGLWWGRFDRLSGRALAAGLALAVTATGVGWIVPKSPPVWPDPLQWFGGQSTAPLKKIGYGQNDLELGGSFVQDDTVAFTAVAPEATYYRGETRDVYTGHGWEAEPTSPDRRIFQALVQGLGEPWPGDGTLRGVPTRTIRQTITVQNGTLPVVVAAYPLSRVLDVTLHHPGAFRADPAGAWITFGNLTPGDQYTVESAVPAGIPEGAKQALPAAPQALPPSVRRDLQLPPGVPARVANLARQVTAGQTGVYGKARALEDYLKAHYRYETERIPVPRPGQDFVDQFLFDSKVGYCDHFSTAMAVMARSIGLPARWVKGFSPGEPAPGQTAGAGDRVFVVRNANAHSWVEVWIPGYGWMPFDPTPAVGPEVSATPSGVPESGTAGGLHDSPGPGANPANQGNPVLPQSSFQANTGRQGGGPSPAAGGPGVLSSVADGTVLGQIGASKGWIAAFPALIALLAAACLYRRRSPERGRRVHPATRELFAGPPPAGAEEAVRRLQAWYVRRNRVLTSGTTLRDILQALVDEVPESAEPASRLRDAMESALYGKEAESPGNGHSAPSAVAPPWRDLGRLVEGPGVLPRGFRRRRKPHVSD